MSRTATPMALSADLYTTATPAPVIQTRTKRARTFRVVEFTTIPVKVQVPNTDKVKVGKDIPPTLTITENQYATIVYCLTPGQALKHFRDETSPKLASTLVSQMRKHGYAFVSDTATIYGRP